MMGTNQAVQPKSCLVADDDAAIRRMIARLLQKAGYLVYEAVDGLEALQHLREKAVDLLVVDFRMPRLGGPGLIRILNSKKSHTRVIAMSGGAAPDEIIEAFEHNVLGFLHKPFHARELLDLIAVADQSAPRAATSTSFPQPAATPESLPSGRSGAQSASVQADTPAAAPTVPTGTQDLLEPGQRRAPASSAPSPPQAQGGFAPTVNVSVSTMQATHVQTANVTPANAPTASTPVQAPPQAATVGPGQAPAPVGDAPSFPAAESPTAAAPTAALFDGLLRDIDVDTLELPVPDPVVVELIRLQTQPDISGAKVRAIVESSPSIARRVMQVANSAYYRSKESVKNLQQAIVRVGNRTVLSLALTMLHRRFYDRAHESLARSEWDHTVFTAIVARELSRRLGRSRLNRDPEEVYLTALFYNVGNAVLLRLAAERLGKRAFTSDTLSALANICERHHQRIGGRILRAWKLPSIVSDVAGSHHTVPKVSRTAPRAVRERAKLIHVLSLSEALVEEDGFKSPVAMEDGIHRDTSLAALGLRDIDVDWVMERARTFRMQ